MFAGSAPTVFAQGPSRFFRATKQSVLSESVPGHQGLRCSSRVRSSEPLEMKDADDRCHIRIYEVELRKITARGFCRSWKPSETRKIESPCNIVFRCQAGHNVKALYRRAESRIRRRKRKRHEGLRVFSFVFFFVGGKGSCLNVHSVTGLSNLRPMTMTWPSRRPSGTRHAQNLPKTIQLTYFDHS